MFVFLIIMFNTKIIKPVEVADISVRTRRMQVLLIILIFSQTHKIVQKDNYIYYIYLPSLY